MTARKLLLPVLGLLICRGWAFATETNFALVQKYDFVKSD